MSKTIICAECGDKYTYEPPKNFEDKRKYCLACSHKKQDSFANPLKPQVNITLDKEPVKTKFDNTPMYVSYAKDLMVIGFKADKAVESIKFLKENLK
jgi:hypothetical protein